MRDWIEQHSEAFERDVLRDFCLASGSLRRQFSRFAESGTVSFSIIQTLVGEPLNKGLLWRLKDMAHHVFLSSHARGPAGPLLDWTLGYVFHESLKLMEDAHQRQYYAPRVECVSCKKKNPLLAHVEEELADIQGQTLESMGREVSRLQKLLELSRKLFCLYFEGCAGHRPLARFLYDNEDLVRQAFGEDSDALLHAVYGEELELMLVEAARSLLESGRFEAAAGALEAALGRKPAMQAALAAQKDLERLRGELPPGAV